MAELGIASMDDLIGRTDLLEVDTSVLHEKNRGLDLSALLIPAQQLNPLAPIRKSSNQDHGISEAFDNKLIDLSRPALEEGVSVFINEKISNLHRSVGTMLSYHISKKFGAQGLPQDTIHVKLEGHGGQSLGFALAKGVYIELEGDSNDYVGKALSGGKVVVYPHRDIFLSNEFIAQDNVIVGNVCLYGATSGEAYFRGKAGERFAVRNSGAIAVVEGVGDHGCEYMTGGRVVILGATGRNFGAGMSGGIAYVFDQAGDFSSKCNKGTIGLEELQDIEECNEVKRIIETHVQYTKSDIGVSILSNWESNIRSFVKVIPHDYKQVLAMNKKIN